MLPKIISILIGYACGLFLSGLFYGKSQNVDVTKTGSGNVGTTNTFRALGKKAGIITLAGDMLKSILAAVIVYFVYRNSASNIHMLMLYAGFGAILGHDFPFYMHFKGGKGVATSAGLILIVFPQVFPICFVVMLIVFLTTHYVSLSSICSAVAFAISVIIFGFLGITYFDQMEITEVIIVVLIISCLCIFQHRTNIKRLRNHTESKVYLSGKKEEK